MFLPWTKVSEQRPTEALRTAHDRFRSSIIELETELFRLFSGSARAEHRFLMKRIVDRFVRELGPHASWEEATLYPLIDELAGGRRERFTAPARYEHEIMKRWLEELELEASKTVPDPRVFARRAQSLFGLVRAHLEVEEQVLLPLIDRRMSREELEREIALPRDLEC